MSHVRKSAPATESHTIRRRSFPWRYHSPMLPCRLASWHAACALALAAAALAMTIGACSAPRDPIVVEEGMVTVENQTNREWRNVKVTINDHFSGGAPVLSAGGRLTAPLSQFQTAFGQKFDR